MKRRYFYRIDKEGKPIPGSNISRLRRPSLGRYKELTLMCCDPDPIPCNCGDDRFWVQVNGINQPVSGSLIKRKERPRTTEGIRFQEVSWLSSCCILEIAPFAASIDAPTGDILDEGGYPFTLETPISVGQDYQLAAVESVTYYVDGVAVGTVTGNAVVNPLHQYNYIYNLPGNTDHTFSTYSVIRFKGGITYQTEPVEFTLQFNDAPTFPSQWGNVGAIHTLRLAVDTVAQIGGYVYPGDNLPDDIEITFDGLPAFCDTPIVGSFSGVRYFQVFVRPTEIAEAGTYPFTVTASDGVNSTTRGMDILVVNIAATTWNPVTIPTTPSTNPKVLTFGDETPWRYNKINNKTPGLQLTYGDSVPETIADNVFITNANNRVEFGAYFGTEGEVPPITTGGEMIMVPVYCLTGGANNGFAIDMPVLLTTVTNP